MQGFCSKPVDMATTAAASCTVNTQELKRKYEQIKSDQLQEKPKMLLQKLSDAFVEKGHTEKDLQVICKLFGSHERMGEILREMRQLVLEHKKPPPPQEVNVLQLLARKEADRAAKQGLPHAARVLAAFQAQPQPDPPLPRSPTIQKCRRWGT